MWRFRIKVIRVFWAWANSFQKKLMIDIYLMWKLKFFTLTVLIYNNVSLRNCPMNSFREAKMSPYSRSPYWQQFSEVGVKYLTAEVFSLHPFLKYKWTTLWTALRLIHIFIFHVCFQDVSLCSHHPPKGQLRACPHKHLLPHCLKPYPDNLEVPNKALSLPDLTSSANINNSNSLFLLSNTIDSSCH